MCADVRVDSATLMMKINQNGNSAPASSPVELVHTRPLSPKAAELLQDRIGNLPVWIRPPKTGNDFYCSLSRAKLYELAAEGKIVSRSIREAGQIKGTRLFLLSSIFEFIANCDEGKPQQGAVNQ
jgi:hypothetical protein